MEKQTLTFTLERETKNTIRANGLPVIDYTGVPAANRVAIR
jgi:hypothetical protein